MTETEHRHRREVRYLIHCVTEKGRHWVNEYLNHKNVAGRAPALKADINTQRRLGNTGKHGEWPEPEQEKNK